MEWISEVVNAPIKSLLVVSGLLLIFASILSKIGDWVSLGRGQRILAGVMGGALLIGGLGLEAISTANNPTSEPTSSPSAVVSSPSSASSPASTASPATATDRSQVSILLENDWKPIDPVAFETYQEEKHPASGRSRDAFSITEEKLNSLGIPSRAINVTVAELGDEWINGAPDAWNNTSVGCFIKVQRRDDRLNYLPCLISGSSGQCELPWQLDASGRRCGGRAASERPGG